MRRLIPGVSWIYFYLSQTYIHEGEASYSVGEGFYQNEYLPAKSQGTCERMLAYAMTVAGISVGVACVIGSYRSIMRMGAVTADLNQPLCGVLTYLQRRARRRYTVSSSALLLRPAYLLPSSL